MEFNLGPSWTPVLEEECKKPFFQKLKEFLQEEYQSSTPIFPPQALIFNALYQTPFEACKVVIVGQDPYHGWGQAHGLCFSVSQGIPPPPSLKNIFKELERDLLIPPPREGSLLSWAHQGVLLLNTVLTVRAHLANSHANKGWEIMTDAIIQKLAHREKPLIFLLWGRSAKEKVEKVLQKGSHHIILTAPHPSPLSAHTGFLGCGHFSKVNELLKKWGDTPIQWQL